MVDLNLELLRTQSYRMIKVYFRFMHYICGHRYSSPTNKLTFIWGLIIKV